MPLALIIISNSRIGAKPSSVKHCSLCVIPPGAQTLSWPRPQRLPPRHETSAKGVWCRSDWSGPCWESVSRCASGVCLCYFKYPTWGGGSIKHDDVKKLFHGASLAETRTSNMHPIIGSNVSWLKDFPSFIEMTGNYNVQIWLPPGCDPNCNNNIYWCYRSHCSSYNRSNRKKP